MRHATLISFRGVCSFNVPLVLLLSSACAVCCAATAAAFRFAGVETPIGEDVAISESLLSPRAKSAMKSGVLDREGRSECLRDDLYVVKISSAFAFAAPKRWRQRILAVRFISFLQRAQVRFASKKADNLRLRLDRRHFLGSFIHIPRRRLLTIFFILSRQGTGRPEALLRHAVLNSSSHRARLVL